MNFQSIIEQLDFTKYKCTFADLRIESVTSSIVKFKDDDLIQANTSPQAGYFIRVFNKGQWFYQSSTDFSQVNSNLEKLIEMSHEYEDEKSTYTGPSFNGAHQLIKNEKNRFDLISINEKISLVQKYAILKDQIANLAEYEISYTDTYKIKFYKNSKGTTFSYDFNQAGLFFNATLKNGDNLFKDSINQYASHFADLSSLENIILEHFEDAQKFLNAKTVEAGKYDLVLSPEIVGIFTHESFGHKSEADFMIGDPDAIKEWELGKK